MRIQKCSGDPNPQYFSTSTAVQMRGVLPYKWEAYCSTNGRCIAGFPFLRSLEARKVRRYKWGAYCRTNGGRTAVLFRQVVGVGVSKTLLTSESLAHYENSQKYPQYHDNSSERPSPEPLLKKEASPAVLRGRQVWKFSGGFKCLEFKGLRGPSRTLKGNFRKSSESVCVRITPICVANR